MDEELLADLGDLAVDWRQKGLPATTRPLTAGDIASQKWNLLDGDLIFPAMALKERALVNNIEAMADFCRRYDVWLAPHGKTSMSPVLFKRQLDAGAWGITAATTSQLRVCRHFGVQRVLMANQLVEESALRWIAAELLRDPAFEFLCLVDSVPGVAVMTEVLQEAGLQRPLRVLVELGYQGGRTGCRTFSEATAVAAAASASSALELAGVEGFEGLIEGDSLGERLAAAERFLADVRRLHIQLGESGAFDGLDYSIVSAGGSAFFDLVVKHLTNFDLTVPVRTIVRSGCYITHDSEMYEEVSPLAERRGEGERVRLTAALELWGTVLSRPEPELAILNFGKRDTGIDYRFPVPEVAAQRKSRELRPIRGQCAIRGMNDQHAYMRLPENDPIAVGDRVGCGISHPCTSFDKWRLIPVVDDDYTVTDAIHTFF